MMQKEIEFLASLLKEGIRTKQLFKSDATRLATSLIILSDSIKHYTGQRAVLEKLARLIMRKGLMR